MNILIVINFTASLPIPRPVGGRRHSVSVVVTRPGVDLDTEMVEHQRYRTKNEEVCGVPAWRVVNVFQLCPFNSSPKIPVGHHRRRQSADWRQSPDSSVVTIRPPVVIVTARKYSLQVDTSVGNLRIPCLSQWKSTAGFGLAWVNIDLSPQSKKFCYFWFFYKIDWKCAGSG